MTTIKFFLSTLLINLLFLSTIHASSIKCVGGQCFATFAKKDEIKPQAEATKYTDEIEVPVVLTAAIYKPTVQTEEMKPFQNLRYADEFIEKESSDSISSEMYDNLNNTIEYYDEYQVQNSEVIELESERPEDVMEESHENIEIVMEEAEMKIEYICEKDTELLVCDIDTKECECV
ncbi:MAG: hypothetical protein K0U38_04785 [Epsilonproteobacteria bacterium]|nr:hypothetical protein [Campylobacterota bacterium]